jgi:hypothetical protein
MSDISSGEAVFEMAEVRPAVFKLLVGESLALTASLNFIRSVAINKHENPCERLPDSEEPVYCSGQFGVMAKFRVSNI